MSRPRSSHVLTVWDRPNTPVWYVWFYVDGKAKQRRTKYRRDEYTREQAQAAIDAIESGLEPVKALTVRWMIEHVTVRLRAAVKLGEIKEGTYDRHINNLSYLFRAFGPDFALEQMNRSTEQRIKETALSLGRAPNTINNILSSCHMAFEKLMEGEYITRNPLSHYRPVPAPRNPIKALTTEERTAFFAMVDARGGESMKGLVHILVAMGMRVTELLSIERKDIDMDAGRVVVPTLKQHGEQSRKLAIPESVRPWFVYFLNRNGSDFPFRTKHRNTIREFVVKTAAECGIKKKISTHSLRHTAATLAIESGKNIRTVQRILGHASLSTTERFYAHDTAQDETLI